MNLKRKSGFGYMTANTLPGGRLVTVSGTPPIAIKNALPRPPQSIRIYGNTVDNTGISDKTKNLLSTQSASVRGVSVSADTTKTRLTFNGTSTGSGGRATPLSNTLTLLPDKSYTFCIKYISGRFIAVGSAASLNLSRDNSSLSFFDTVYNQTSMTQCLDYVHTLQRQPDSSAVNIFLGLNVNVGDFFENYTLEVTCYEGIYTLNTIPAAEPYGAYKLPIEISNGDNSDTYNIYTSDQLLSSQILYVYPDDRSVIIHDTETGIDTDISYLQSDLSDIQLYKGTNIIDINTYLPPSGLSVSYFR